MHEILSGCLNAMYFGYAAFLSVLFELHFLLVLAVFLLLGKGGFDDAMRFHNWYYGGFMVCLFRPLIRVRRRGIQHAPRGRPLMVVTNHRSFFDMFFMGLTPQRNTATLVRSWPFRMPILGWFMRRAGYIDVERLPFAQVTARAQALAARGVSFLCFPEGHRSPDGRLQRFQSGPFRLATEANLPVLPICLSGTEKIRARLGSFPRPVDVHIEILPPVDPAWFPAEKRALKLRRHVESIFKEHLGD